jgi:hypothetical protein
MFVIAVPLTHVILLLVMWFTPLPLRPRRVLLVAAEVANAWSAMDVFMVSLVAALLEIRQFTSFMIGGRCDVINRIIAEYFSQEVGGDTKCFDVEVQFKEGCWYYLVAMLIYTLTATLVMRVALLAADQDLDRGHGQASLNAPLDEEMPTPLPPSRFSIWKVFSALRITRSL